MVNVIYWNHFLNCKTFFFFSWGIWLSFKKIVQFYIPTPIHPPSFQENSYVLLQMVRYKSGLFSWWHPARSSQLHGSTLDWLLTWLISSPFFYVRPHLFLKFIPSFCRNISFYSSLGTSCKEGQFSDTLNIWKGVLLSCIVGNLVFIMVFALDLWNFIHVF